MASSTTRRVNHGRQRLSAAPASMHAVTSDARRQYGVTYARMRRSVVVSSAGRLFGSKRVFRTNTVPGNAATDIPAATRQITPEKAKADIGGTPALEHSTTQVGRSEGRKGVREPVTNLWL